MIKIKNVSRTFHMADNDVEALKNVTINIGKGDIFGIIGTSGAGKSTLVRCINMLERPDEGAVEIEGVDIVKLSPAKLREVRRSIAMIFQGFNLLMQRNCLKNVCFPMELAGVKKAEAEAKALELLDIVGLKDKASAYPCELSGGQQQRVAIARALATNPKILLCDEATSALDPNTTNSILELIRDINKKLGITVVIIPHQMSVVESICKHVAILDHGVVAEQGEVTEVFTSPKSAAARSLVFPEGDSGSLIAAGECDRFIRVVFNGAHTTGKPVIAGMALNKGIEANISYASTKSIDGKVYGSMLLGIDGDDSTVATAIEYLTQNEDIMAEEVMVNVG